MNYANLDALDLFKLGQSSDQGFIPRLQDMSNRQLRELAQAIYDGPARRLSGMYRGLLLDIRRILTERRKRLLVALGLI